MWIDIIQAYADTLYVATTQRPVPRDRGRRSDDAAAVRVVPSPPSPGPLRRLGRWLARQRGRIGRVGPTADVTAAKGCG